MMKACMKALVVAGLCVSMALGMVGCGSKPMDGSQVVATVGEKEMTLGCLGSSPANSSKNRHAFGRFYFLQRKRRRKRNGFFR